MADGHLRVSLHVNVEGQKVNMSELLPSTMESSGSQMWLAVDCAKLHFSPVIHRRGRRKAVCCFLHHHFYYLEGFAVLPDVSPRGAVYIPVELGPVDVPPSPVKDGNECIYHNIVLKIVPTSV